MDALLDRIEAYRRQHLLEETTFGLLVANDANLIKDLKGGRRLRLRTLARLERALTKTPAEVSAETLSATAAAE